MCRSNLCPTPTIILSTSPLRGDLWKILTKNPRHTSFVSLECTEFKMTLFEKFPWAPFEVAEALWYILLTGWVQRVHDQVPPLSDACQKTSHNMFLEHWNRQKSLSNIWQRFSCLLDERIAKKCKKTFFRGGFFLNPLYPFWDAHGQAG